MYPSICCVPYVCCPAPGMWHDAWGWQPCKSDWTTKSAWVILRKSKWNGCVPASPLVLWGVIKTLISKWFSSTNILALTSMKNVAKCDSWCELRNLMNHLVFERKLCPRLLGQGKIFLGIMHCVAPLCPCMGRTWEFQLFIIIIDDDTAGCTIGQIAKQLQTRTRIKELG